MTELRKIVGTRVAIRYNGQLPSVEWVEWRLHLLSILAPAMEQPWILLADPERLQQVAHAAPDEVYFDPTATTYGRWFVWRQDSDDMWAPKVLARSYDLPPNTLMDWPVGWQHDLITGDTRLIDYRNRNMVQGPYLAVTHTGTRPVQTVLGRDHEKMRNGRTVITSDEPAWLQIIHGGNLKNRMRTGIECDPAEVGDVFGLDLSRDGRLANLPPSPPPTRPATVQARPSTSMTAP